MKPVSSKAGGNVRGIERVGSITWVWVTLVAAVLAYSCILWVEARQDRLSSHLRDEQTLLRQARVDLARGYLHISLGGRPDSPFDRAQGLALLGQAHSSLEKAVRLQRELEGGAAPVGAEDARPVQLAGFARAVAQFRGTVMGRQGDPASDSALMTERRIAFFSLERQAEQVEAQIQQELSATLHRYDIYQKAMTGGAGILLAVICLSAFAGDQARKGTEAQRSEAEETIHRQDATLREAERRYRDLWEKAPVMMISLDSGARMNFVSDRFCEELGYRRDDVLGKTPFEFQTAESAHYARSDVFHAFLRTGVVKDAPLQLVRANGEVIDVLLNVTAERDSQGTVIRSRSVFTDITERKRAEDALRASLDEKVALLKEIHHRVKNNLQIVASLLSLQAGRSRSDEVLSVLRDTRNRVRAMALLHETLYRSENFARLNFKRYLKDLCGQLLVSYSTAGERIRMEYRIADIGLSMDQAVPCGLIVSELVSNALKYGFPGDRAGKITVGLDVTDDRMLILSVEDDGIGLPADLDIDGASTLGLKLVSGLTDQLGGRLESGGLPGPGAVFRVIIPGPFPLSENV